ncbi:MAG: SDR family oxidoreductase [Flavobacteriaceae bacterium]
MKVLILGATGMLGRALAKTLASKYDITGIGRSEANPDTKINYKKIDLLDKTQLKSFFDQNQYDSIINCAAIINHSFCEENPKECNKLNAELNHFISKLVSPKTKYIFISSDAVFKDDDKDRTELGETNPDSIYGKSKLLAESIVSESFNNYIIVRTTILGFSPRKTSLTDWIISTAQSNKTLNLFDDVLFNPISVWSLSSEIAYLIEHFSDYSQQLLHINGAEKTTKYNFGLGLLKQLKMDHNSVKKTSILDFSNREKRVLNQCLDVNYYQNLTKRHLPTLNSTIETICKNFSK